MAGQALYRKWRPKSFEEVVGQEHVTQTLKNALATGRAVHAYLFSGPRGTGKTSTARILAKGLNCLGPENMRPDNTCQICQSIDEGRLLDLIEIDAASHGLVDDARELVEKVIFAPSQARYKVYIIDEVHMLSTAASNALLKTLEEPPRHAYFILATTEPHKILPTILSRCQRFDFRPIPMQKIIQRLKGIVSQEGWEAEEEALQLLARQANGSMRDGDSLLDQVASTGQKRITMVQVQAILGSVAPQAVSNLARHIAEKNLSAGLSVIDQAIGEGADPRQLARQLIEYLRGVLLLKAGGQKPPQATPEVAQEMAKLGEVFSLERLTTAIRNFNRASWDFKASLPPELPLELAFVESVQFEEEGKTSPPTSPPKGAPPSPAAEELGPQPGETGGRRSPGARSGPAATRPTRPTLSTRELGNIESDPAALEKLQGLWEKVLGEVRAKSLHVEAILRSSQPVAVNSERVVLGFFFPFHKGQIENARNRELVMDVLSQVLGQRVGVQCVLLREKPQTKSPPASEDAVIRVARQMGAEVSSLGPLPTTGEEASEKQ